MPVNLSNSNDIIANTVSVIDGNLVVDLYQSIRGIQGIPPATLNTLERLASAINNDPTYFTTINNILLLKADKTYVDNLVNGLIDNAPTALNTLKELATALANDANYATNIQNQLNLKQPLITITNPSDGYRLITANNIIKGIKATLPLNISEDSNVLRSEEHTSELQSH